jgi:plastocyanin
MRAFTLLALLMAVSMPLAACGDDDESEGDGGGGQASGGAGQTLRIAADPGGELAFDKSSLTAEAGNVTIVMANPSDLPHAVEIEGGGVEVAGDTVMKGGVSEASADLEPGEYEFYCPVGNHRDAGMEGTLTVN